MGRPQLQLPTLLIYTLYHVLYIYIQGDPKKQNPYIFVEVIMGSVFFGSPCIYMWWCGRFDPHWAFPSRTSSFRLIFVDDNIYIYIYILRDICGQKRWFPEVILFFWMRDSFLIFPFFYLFCLCPLPVITNTFHFSSLQKFLCFPDLTVIIIIYTFRVFSISWWFFTGVWVTASLLKSPGLFSVFWPSSIVLSFGWSPLIY